MKTILNNHQQVGSSEIRKISRHVLMIKGNTENGLNSGVTNLVGI